MLEDSKSIAEELLAGVLAVFVLSRTRRRVKKRFRISYRPIKFSLKEYLVAILF